MHLAIGTRLLVVALLAAATACRPSPSTTSRSLRVMVYNIHAGKDAGNIDNLDRVAALIRETSADIVLLQEVDRGTQRSGGVDQPAELAKRTGLHTAFGKSLAYQGGDYGIAIMSRWPINEQSTVALSVDPPQERAGGSHEPRVALRVTVTAPMGRLTVINTHVDASRDDTWRRQEIPRVVAIADSATGIVLLGGDLNSTPESDVQQAVRARGLRDAWTTCGAPGAAGFTYPADSGVKRIDYLYFRPTTWCRRAEVVATQASDHRPLLVDVVVGRP